MRDLSPAVKSLLASGEQVEPVAIVELHLAGNKLVFADRKLSFAQGRILAIGNLDEAQRSDSTGMAGSVNVVLDDRDGLLKGIFDKVDIHKTKVNVYQSFVGLSESAKFLIFAGQIATPLIWNEGKRTFSFDIVSKLEDFEVGWSADMGNYGQLPQELLGAPWPLVFGTVHHSPCLQLQNIPTAFTTGPCGIVDQAVDTRLAQLQNLLQLAISATVYYSSVAISSVPRAAFGSANDAVDSDPNVQKYLKMQKDIQLQILELKQTQSWQLASASNSTGLIPTVYVTQPYSGPFRVGNGLFSGSLNRDRGSITAVSLLNAGSPANEDSRQGFQFFSAGSQAVIAGNYPLRYVASVTPGRVLKVWAMRSFNGIRQMSAVPRSYYNIETHPIGKGMVATYVVLKQPLSTKSMLENINTQQWENAFGKSLPPHIVNQVDWEDDLYVSFQSDVGPNAVDILEWVITNFSQNGIDTESFDAVRLETERLPMSFTLSGTPNVMSLVADIAYQAKCLIYLREDVFHLLYLPKKPDPVDTISEDDVMVDTLEVSCTPTEDLVTKYVATFRPDYSPFFNEPVKLTTRYNIPKYGVHEESHDFFCYNNYGTVQAAATFWVIRKSQTYKTLKARLLLTKLNLEVFDYVTLDFQKPYIAKEAVVGMITKCQYDSANKWIDVEIWCPVLLGEMKQSPFAWPAGAETQVAWPQYQEMAGGGGSSMSSPQLPPSNPRTEETRTRDVGGPRVQTAQQPLDWGAAYPEILDFVPAEMPRSKAFPWTPTASSDPTQDYKFKPLPDPSIEPLAGSYPASVKDKIDDDHYVVDVYTEGLKKKPRELKVKQLQIDSTDVIPSGTWTFASLRQGTDDDGESYTEWTMQVPVWLQ